MPELIYEKHDHFAIFTMNRPEQLNALGGKLLDEQTEALADAFAEKRAPVWQDR